MYTQHYNNPCLVTLLSVTQPSDKYYYLVSVSILWAASSSQKIWVVIVGNKMLTFPFTKPASPFICQLNEHFDDQMLLWIEHRVPDYYLLSSSPHKALFQFLPTIGYTQ